MAGRRVLVEVIGQRAWEALAGTAGRARVVGRAANVLYLRARDEIMFLAGLRGCLHPRAALVTAPGGLPPAAPGEILVLDVSRARRWRLGPWRPRPRRPQMLARRSRELAARLLATTASRGFGCLLGGGDQPEWLRAAGADARAFAAACATDQARRAAEAALPLVGLGPGLTPAGDDFVGAAFFARLLLGPATSRPAWIRAAGLVRARAARATHPVSAALLDDLLRGEGPAALHALTALLASEVPVERGVAVGQAVLRLGHSSGWDLVAGLLAALTGPGGKSDMAGSSALAAEPRASRLR